MGGPAPDRKGGDEPRAIADFHDAARRVPGGAHQHKRGGRRAAARRCRHGSPARPSSLAAPHAAGVRVPCRIPACAHRNAGERAGLRGVGGCWAGAVRLFRVRHRGRAAGARHDRHRRAVRPPAAAESRRTDDSVRSQQARPNLGGAVQTRRRAVSTSRSRAFASGRNGAERDRPEGLSGPRLGRGAGRRAGRPVAEAGTRRGRHSHRARRSGDGRCFRGRQARCVPRGRGRLRHAVQSHVRPGRGRHPSPIRLPGGISLSGNGHAQRRSCHPGRATPRRGPGPRRDGARSRRYAAAPGNLEGARRAPRRSQRAGGRFAGARAPPGRSHGSGGEAGHRRAARHGDRPRDRCGTGRHRWARCSLRDGVARAC